MLTISFNSLIPSVNSRAHWHRVVRQWTGKPPRRVVGTYMLSLDAESIFKQEWCQIHTVFKGTDG